MKVSANGNIVFGVKNPIHELEIDHTENLDIPATVDEVLYQIDTYNKILGFSSGTKGGNVCSDTNVGIL